MEGPIRSLTSALAAGAALIAASGALAATMNWPDLLDRPRPAADRRIAYGADPLQHVDLWLPSGKAPHPVVLMVHGGCWQTEIAEADIMNYIAADLRTHGIAVWNIEYRGVDRPGGGYPGTFLDVAAAADALARLGPKLGLKVDRVVALGHSAGGHLALWLAARPKIAAASPLHAQRPIGLAGAISIGGLPDLAAAAMPPGDTCGAEAVHKLTGPGRPHPYADTSPAELLPFATPQLLINATMDRIAPPAFADAYAARAAARGVTVRRMTVPDEGHVELIAPGSAAWTVELAEIRRALGVK